MQGFRSVKDAPPNVGTLCLVYFPVGECNLLSTTRTFGPLAVAYKLEDGWKMADVPSPLRGLLGDVGPMYWKELVL